MSPTVLLLPLPLRERAGVRGPAATSLGPPGPLRNGNPRGHPNLAPRCGAKNCAASPAARAVGSPDRIPLR